MKEEKIKKEEMVQTPELIRFSQAIHPPEAIYSTVHPVDFTSYVQSVIGELEKEKKYAAAHVYSCTLNSFSGFSRSVSGADNMIPVDEVFTSGRLKAYQEWMVVTRELSWNSVSTYMRTLRAVYNRLYPPGSVEHNPKLFAEVHTRVESRTKRALTARQTGALLNVDFDALPEELHSALAYFLLMLLFRGMPFIDLAHLRKQDLKGNVITYCRHKTGRPMTVRIPREATELFKKYKDTNPGSTYLFPILEGNLKSRKHRDKREIKTVEAGEGMPDSNCKVNDVMQAREKEKVSSAEAGNAAGYSSFELYRRYQAALRRFNNLLRKVGMLALKGIKLSSYTARHTWATLAYHEGLAIGLISQALGHSSIRVTETYLKPFDNKRIDRVNDKLISTFVKWKEQSRMNVNML